MVVLLLNASFEPLHVIPLRRAMGLVVAGKVDVIANGDGEIHSATQTFPIPAVLRLRYMVRVPFRQNIALSRRAVLIRDQRLYQVAVMGPTGVSSLCWPGVMRPRWARVATTPIMPWPHMPR